MRVPMGIRPRSRYRLDWVRLLLERRLEFAMVQALDREELTKSDIQALPVAAGPDYSAANEWLLPSCLSSWM